MVKCDSEKDFGDMTLVIGGKEYVQTNDEWMFPAQKPNLAQSNKMKFSMGVLGPQLMVQVSSSQEEWDNTPIFNNDILTEAQAEEGESEIEE